MSFAGGVAGENDHSLVLRMFGLQCVTLQPIADDQDLKYDRALVCCHAITWQPMHNDSTRTCSKYICIVHKTTVLAGSEHAR